MTTHIEHRESTVAIIIFLIVVVVGVCTWNWSPSVKETPDQEEPVSQAMANGVHQQHRFPHLFPRLRGIK